MSRQPSSRAPARGLSTAACLAAVAAWLFPAGVPVLAQEPVKAEPATSAGPAGENRKPEAQERPPAAPRPDPVDTDAPAQQVAPVVTEASPARSATSAAGPLPARAPAAVEAVKKSRVETAGTAAPAPAATTAASAPPSGGDEAGFVSGSPAPAGGSAVADTGPARTSENLDPVLLDLVSNLKALIEGKLPTQVEISSLFTLPVDRFDMVQRRLQSLPQEVGSAERALSALERRLASPEQEIPEVEKPAVLLKPLLAPEPPVEPELPARPEKARPRSKWAKQKNPDLARAWQAYDESLVLYEQAKERYREQRSAYEQQLVAHEEASRQREAAREAFEQAKVERLAQLERWQRELSRQRSLLHLRLEVARLRLRYLEALVALIRPLPQAARQSLSSLAAPRHSLRSAAAEIREINHAVGRLRSRVEVLANRGEADALAGLLVDRKAVRGSLVTLLAALSDLIDRFEADAVELENLAARLEKEGGALQRSIFLSALVSERQKRLDALFLQHLKESRFLARAGGYDPQAVSEPAALAKRIDGLLPVPERIGTASQAKKALNEIYSVIEQAETLQRDADPVRLRYHRAFKREAVALLTGLASAETRARAYSLSVEFLGYLKADLDVVGTRLQGFFAKKLAQWKNLPRFASTAEGALLLSSIAIAIVVPLIVLRIRKRLRGLVNAAVRRLRRLDFFRRRIGAVVRWAALAQALLPALVFLAAGYGALFLVGFRHVEIRFIEVAFRYGMLFVLGRQLLLGLTLQVSRRQPALLHMAPVRVDLLRISYDRLGLGLALAASLEEWSRLWLGAGSLSALCRWAVWLWVLVWSLWAALAWRRALGETLLGKGREGSPWRKLGRLMTEHVVFALLSPVALVLVVADAIVGAVRSGLQEGGFFTFLRARSLRRMSRRATEVAEQPPGELPERYTREFPLYPILGEEEAEVIVRRAEVDRVLEQLERWKASRQDGSLVLIGDKGIGKTTMAALLTRRITSLPVSFHTVSRKIRNEKDLVRDLAPVVGDPDAANIGMLSSHLNQGEERVLLIDEAHNLFLRTVDGYQAYEALVRLVNFTSNRVFWILVFNRFSWEFLNQSRRRVHYFRKLLHLQPWSADDLKELIARRNERAGLNVQFDEFLLDGGGRAGEELELVESVDAYFQLLRESSGGNPRVATYLWLNSLRPLSENRLRLGLFREESTEHLEKLDSELLFALAAICQHENLSVAELREELNVPLDFAGFAMRYLSEYGYIEPKHTDGNRFTLAPRFYPQVLKVLRARHLLFE